MLCHVCRNDAVGQCKGCGKFYCSDHGDLLCVRCSASARPFEGQKGREGQFGLSADVVPERPGEITDRPVPAQTGPKAAGYSGSTCFDCGAAAAAACGKCGRFHCPTHGKRRADVSTGEGGLSGINLCYLCYAEITSARQVGWPAVILGWVMVVIVAVSILVFMMYMGWQDRKRPDTGVQRRNSAPLPGR